MAEAPTTLLLSSEAPIRTQEDFNSDVYRSRKRIHVAIFSKYESNCKDALEIRELFGDRSVFGLTDTTDNKGDIKYYFTGDNEFDKYIKKYGHKYAEDGDHDIYTADWYDVFVIVFLCDKVTASGGLPALKISKEKAMSIEKIVDKFNNHSAFESKPMVFLFQLYHDEDSHTQADHRPLSLANGSRAFASTSKAPDHNAPTDEINSSPLIKAFCNKTTGIQLDDYEIPNKEDVKSLVDVFEMLKV